MLNDATTQRPIQFDNLHRTEKVTDPSEHILTQEHFKLELFSTVLITTE